MRKSVALLVIVAMLPVIAACTGNLPTGGHGQRRIEVGGVASLPLWWEPPGQFNPLWAEHPADRRVVSMLFDGLFTPGPGLEPLPALAESYTVVGDGLSVIFHLREDIFWHDGEPVTARDVVFTWEQLLCPDYDGPARPAGEIIDAIEGAREYLEGEADHVAGMVIDEETGTLTVRLTTPLAPLLTRLVYQKIVPEHVYWEMMEENEDEGAALAQWKGLIVGTGPFVYREWEPGLQLIFSRNDRYFDGKPYLDGVVLKIVPVEVALGLLETGELDILPIDIEDLRYVRRMEGVSVVEYPQLGYQYMGINLADPLLSDRRVRQAIALGLNREAIVESVMLGAATAIDGPLLPAYWAAGEEGLPGPVHDIDAARRLLEQAGWTPGEDDKTLVDADGRRFEVTLKYPAADPQREQLASVIADSLGELGMRITPVVVDYNRLLGDVFDRRDCQLYLLGWNLALDPDPEVMWGGDSRWNPFRFSTEYTDELMALGRSTLEYDRRTQLYREWNNAVAEEAPYVFLYMPHALLAVADRLHGLEADLSGYLGSIHRWWIPARERRPGT